MLCRVGVQVAAMKCTTGGRRLAMEGDLEYHGCSGSQVVGFLRLSCDRPGETGSLDCVGSEFKATGSRGLLLSCA
eukprot:357329-Chlamydomonas_euryale.AAC.13